MVGDLSVVALRFVGGVGGNVFWNASFPCTAVQVIADAACAITVDPFTGYPAAPCGVLASAWVALLPKGDVVGCSFTLKTGDQLTLVPQNTAANCNAFVWVEQTTTPGAGT